MIEAGKCHVGSIVDGRELLTGGRDEIEVLNPYNNEVIGKISCATPEDATEAVVSAHRVYTKIMKKMPPRKRSEILRKTADLLEIEASGFAHLLSLEGGTPIKVSQLDAARAVQVLHLTSEGAESIYGEMGHVGAGKNRVGMSKRVSLGVVTAIIPFNFPLNLMLHKIASAIAAGNTVILKPSEKTPLTPVFLYRMFEKAGLPKGVFNIVMGLDQELTEILVTHPKVKCVTFTGSSVDGRNINEMAKRKKIIVELESVALTIIFEDADLDIAAQTIIGGFTYAGSARLSAQQIYVHERVYQAFLEKLIRKVAALKTGDPLDETTDIGPLMTQEAAERAESWIREAVGQGATLSAGGKRRWALIEPAIVSDVTPDMKAVCEEVFAPLVSVGLFGTEAAAVDNANASDFGLRVGVFTADINRAMRMADALDMGGVWIEGALVRRNADGSYGRVKNSGMGKEGIIYAIEEMTNVRFISI